MAKVQMDLELISIRLVLHLVLQPMDPQKLIFLVATQKEIEQTAQILILLTNEFLVTAFLQIPEHYQLLGLQELIVLLMKLELQAPEVIFLIPIVRQQVEF